MNERDICDTISQALELKAGTVTMNDGAHTINAWDSLGFLAILSSLERKFGSRVAAIDDLAGVQSVREIVEIFKREKII